MTSAARVLKHTCATYSMNTGYTVAMNAKMLRPYFLIALISISFVLVFFIFRPFIVVLLMAAIFATVLQPLYRRILHPMKSSPGLAALITMLISIVCILVPLGFIATHIVSDAQSVYTQLSENNQGTYLHTLSQYAQDITTQYAPGLTLSSAEISASIDEYLKNSLTWLIQHLGGAFGGATRFLLDLFIFLIALYYLLKDGAKLKQKIFDMSPLADTEDTVVFARLEQAVHSIIRGSLLIALIQGVLTGIGFAIFGVPNSMLWGVVAAFSALIPGIGTSLVLIPGVIYLFIIGATTGAIGLLIWSVVAVGLIDNLLGPRLVGKGMQLHPLIVLLSVFGGLVFFGPAGIFIGPLATNLLFALLSIYHHVSREATV
jgi:predicted PurR-regulated permease PerM